MIRAMRRPPRCPSRLLPLALWALAAVAAAGPASGVASPWSENPQSRVRLVTPYAVAPTEGEIWLGIQLTVIPGWHVYWKNSGDAGFAPTIDASATPEVGVAELLFPAPERYELPGDLVAFGYSDEVVYPIRAQIAAGARETVRLVVRVDYLVCEIDCIPYSYELAVDQPVAALPVPDPETSSVLAVWRSRLPRPVAEVAGVSTDARLELADPQRPVLLVTLEGVRPAGGTATELFLEAHELFDAGRPVREETPTGLFFRIPLVAKQVLDEAPKRSTFAWTVTGLVLAETGAGAENEPPRAATPPPDAADAVAEPHFAIAAERMVAGVIPDEQEGAVATSPLGGMGSAGLVARALGGGLFLAFTPGALALWLLTLGGCRRATAQGDVSGLTLAGAAAAGGVLTAVLLATVALARGGGWTRPHAEPPTLVLLALASLLLALGMWGLVRRGGGGEGSGEPRALTAPRAFGAGALATLLSLPWPLPPAPGAVDAALGRGALAGLAASLALGVGLSLPLLATALLDQRGEGALPEEEGGIGRRALGFIALGNLVWIVYLLSSQLRSETLAFVELAILAVAMGVWLRRRSERRGARTAFVLLALAAAAAAVLLAMR